MTYREAFTKSDEEDKYILEERAAIMEFDGGLSRIEAEIQSVKSWLKDRWHRLRRDAGLLD